MARIYRRSDRIKVKIDDIQVELAPLSVDQKAEIQQLMFTGRTRGDIQSATKGMQLSLKYAVKSVSGVEDSDGNAYALSFDDQGNLQDSCVDDLLNLEVTEKLSLCCATLARGIPAEFTDNFGKKLEGVEIVRKAPTEKN